MHDGEEVVKGCKEMVQTWYGTVVYTTHVGTHAVGIH